MTINVSKTALYEVLSYFLPIEQAEFYSILQRKSQMFSHHLIDKCENIWFYLFI